MAQEPIVSSLSMAETSAASVDVTKDGWWLTPYKATKEWTIGVSYTDVSISYIAALQKAVQNKAKEMGVKIIEVDAKNDTNVELSIAVRRADLSAGLMRSHIERSHTRIASAVMARAAADGGERREPGP
jgi:hypothetical protein